MVSFKDLWVKIFRIKYCGSNSRCYNTIGSFTCPCNTGYYNFKPNIGWFKLNANFILFYFIENFRITIRTKL